MINIAVLTTTRAEYGLMRQLIFRMMADDEINLNLLVTGTHLSKKFGMTIDEIIDDNVPIAYKIDIISENNGIIDVPQTMANAIVYFAEHFNVNRYDYLLVDGDRYETLAVCIAAVNSNIPIIHCGGGETTEGANDEYWRHAITKLSYIHFPIMETYRKRIITMGENPKRVHTVGAMGLENIRLMEMASKEEIEKRLDFSLDMPYALVTFHPVTLENGTSKWQIAELLSALEEIKDMKFVFTKANADKDGEIINNCINKYVEKHKESTICVASLGAKYYLSAMKYCEFVIGNSSSGITETPSFGIPTINIGDRQKGREQAKSIINCKPIKEEILSSISMARTLQFKNACKEVVNPNGDGKTSERIVDYIKRLYKNGEISTQKAFYDVEIDEKISLE